MRTPSSPGYIGSLCLALLHRWDPERVFVIATAYIDESGTHSETLVMTGYLGDLSQWYGFERRLAALFKSKGIGVFHAKEFRDSDGPFAGWPVNKKTRFLDDFGVIANEQLEFGCNTVLKLSDYRKFYASGPRLKKVQLDTAYGVCFRATLDYLASTVATRVSTSWPANTNLPRSLHVVIEQGAKNLGDCIRIFHEYKRDLLPEYRGIVGTITPETKESCLPLAVSDLVVHGAWRQEEGYRATWRADFRIKMNKAYKKNHVRLGIEEAALRKLRQIHEEKDAEILARGARHPRGSE
jgi:hypothetical protein